MLSTLTSKGQITLPKAIRDQLGLDAGSQLHFELLPDGTIRARAVKPDARTVRGLLKSPLAQPPGIEAEDAALAQHLRDKHRRA
jgi:AbrB family looped-hinge helix DNA binding protein